MAKYYDIHNHLFNKDFLGKELLYRLILEMKKLLPGEEKQERGIIDRSGKLGKVIQVLKRYRYAVRVFSGRNSAAIYRELDKTYQGEFILTPLTFDLTWCFTSGADLDTTEETESDFGKTAERKLASMLSDVERRGKSLSRDFNPSAGSRDDELWKSYLKEKELFLKSTRKLKASPGKRATRASTEKGFSGIPGAFDGFQEQIDQLTELKNNPAYKDLIYPFLAVDPRRPGIAEYARENVGRGKLFAGIKIYCPNGYSPTDPLLYGTDGQKDGIYGFCETNGIPVTAHNSNSGFATFMKKVKINGDIHVNGKLIRLNNEMLVFRSSILGKDAVEERVKTLNHPLLWAKVVDKYPGLILNLAHFGGGEQLGKALDKPTDQRLWSNRIISLIQDSRYNVYTDLACHFDFDVIRRLQSSPVFSGILHKVLYGSDFTLILLYENNFKRNIKQFREIFGIDFEIIAGANPREFLRYVI